MTSEAARKNRRLGRVLVGAVLTGVVLAGCGDSEPRAAKPETAAESTATTTATTTRVTVANGAPTAAAGGGTAAVDVRQFQFKPAELAVNPGTAVTWTNQDDILHTATSGATPGTADGQFDGPMDGRGKSFSHTFDQPGRYPYFCSRHTSMTGTVVVQ